MSSRKIQPGVRASWIYSTRLHVILYSLLLVATPFIFLQSFLVEKISQVSSTRIALLGRDLPLMPILALVVVVAGVVWIRKRITRYLLAAIAVAVLMDALVQQIADYYFGHNFYDLQQNWHYIAYGIFAYMMYRDLRPRGVSTASIMWLTYLIALGFSVFDETFQRYLSSRVFDIGDNAKDLWGALMGIVIVHVGGPDGPEICRNWRPLLHRRLRDYFAHPVSSLLVMFLFALLLVCNGSLLSDFENLFPAVALTVIEFVVIFVLVHVTQFRPGRYAVAALLVIAAGAQAWAYAKYRSENIVYNAYGLTVYKGMPIPFYDLLIFPDGSFRPVDKKHYFNSRDQRFFLRFETDILLIGKGTPGLGGQGFDETGPYHFVFNPYTRKATQIIILPTEDACRVFNRLKEEGKNVLFVLHNTC